MKKHRFSALFIGLLLPFCLSAQYFRGSFGFNSTTKVLSFYVKPTGGAITSTIGYFEFNVRYPASSDLTFGAITNNTAVFPGLNMTQGPGTDYGGQKIQKFNFTSTISSATYQNDVEYFVFSVVLAGTGAPTIDLLTNYDPPGTKPVFAVSNGSGDPLIDVVTPYDIFYPSQIPATPSSGDIYMSLTVALPLDLTTFSARAGENSIDLFWETKSETQFYGFEIQRSENGGQAFQKIGFQKGKGGTETANYGFPDFNVRPGIDYFYRLKMLDLDGRYSFSNIEKARLEGNEAAVKVWPNPVSDFLKIENIGASDADFFKIVDQNGKTVSAGFLSEKGLTEVEVAGLPDGPYVLLLFSEWVETGTFRFVKMR